MIPVELARQLAAAGLDWHPSDGDLFVIPRTELEDHVFMISDMVVEVEHVHGRGIVKFNGTTEWALDAMAQGDVVWLPREHQLREALGTSFQALTRVGRPDAAQWVVTVETGGVESRARDSVVEIAYARALLDVLTRRGA